MAKRDFQERYGEAESQHRLKQSHQEMLTVNGDAPFQVNGDAPFQEENK